MSNVEKYAQAISEGILGFKSKKEKAADEKKHNETRFQKLKAEYIGGSEMLARHTEKVHKDANAIMQKLNSCAPEDRLDHLENLRQTLNDHDNSPEKRAAAESFRKFGQDFNPSSGYPLAKEAKKVVTKNGRMSTDDVKKLSDAYDKHGDRDGTW